ncbi:HesB/YadR/YfhF family protein [Lederbergia lenta]|uniref:YneR n=1 Tax=Lederbergia lenta TaxID=1467 RepID=A0A2X4WLB8_LEDLE|nr:HesB/YadR/YfhF family protein [Lederbergia lenta]MCM3109700.1 HesB/YadR/YfhF family protein [Lederbergia lenta]MEC2324549.1 HesB/YadR/YfhF family protein [Lederbergia lenta]SQI59492.1 YneR [Lederbergia lenta]
MNITLTDKALEWFKDEMLLKKGDFVRFYVRYGGSSPIQEGFSLGVNKEEPMEVGVSHEQDGVIYFVEERDTWYFDKYDLFVDYDEKTDGPSYEYK